MTDIPSDGGYQNRIREIQRIAACVAASGNRQDRADFVDDAPALVLVGLRDGKPAPVTVFDPARAMFTTWVHSVLRNAWVDSQRRKRPTMPLPEDLPTDEPAWRVGTRLADRLDTPFAPPDLVELSRWDPILRLELLCLGGLWQKIPREVWEDWLLLYESVRVTKLPRPLPPEDWDPARPPGDRTHWLAEALGYRPNSLAVRWNRRKEDLQKLSFVRDLGR
jgi:hypothetical protein